jgi:hypothetical protein
MFLMAFKAQSNTYRVKIKVFQERFDRGFSPWALPPSETAYKTPPVKATLKDSDINTISIISGFKGRGFES